MPSFWLKFYAERYIKVLFFSQLIRFVTFILNFDPLVVYYYCFPEGVLLQAFIRWMQHNVITLGLGEIDTIYLIITVTNFFYSDLLYYLTNETFEIWLFWADYNINSMVSGFHCNMGEILLLLNNKVNLYC